MPPKRKPVQKETKVTKQTATESALKSVENNEGMAVKDDEGLDEPVQEVPANSPKKAPAKKQKNKNTNDPEALKESSEDKESNPTINEEIVRDQLTDKDTTKKIEAVTVRRGKRGAHMAEEAPPILDDNIEKIGEAQNPDREENPPIEAKVSKKKRNGKKNVKEASSKDIEDVVNEGSSIDTEQNPKSETLPKKREGKKHVQEASSKDIEDVVNEGSSIDTEQNPKSETLPKKREGKKHVQVPEKEAEPVTLRRGARRNVQAAKEVPKAESNGEEASDDAVPEPKGAGKKRGVNKKESGPEPDEKKNKLEETTSYECEKTSKKGDKWNLKISTWNVAGMRAWIKKNGLDYIKEEDADIVCLQETKCPESKVPPEAKVEGYHTFWANSEKDGYAGVALYSKEKPLNVTYGINNAEYDNEGRAITAEYEKFYLVTTYVPNAGQGLKTLPKRMGWEEIFRNYLKELDAKKPVIICGDMNVAHEEIDLANPKTNTKHAGFTKEEREKMTELLKEGFVDSFRQLYPEKTGCYTFWSFMGNARARNTGWRLDYFIVSERLMDSVCDVAIRNKVLGSDHCPVTLFIHV